MSKQALLCLLLQLLFEICSSTHLQVVSGSTLELPCLMSETDLIEGPIAWKYNGNDIIPSQSSGSLRLKKNGLYLAISPVTFIHEGEYVCLVKDNNMEMGTTYNITVEAFFDYTIKVNSGSAVRLPCHVPSSQVNANALWFKDEGNGRRTQLIPVGESISDDRKLELLYPFDRDHTIILSEPVVEDTGIYHCESAEGKKFSTVNLIVEAAPTPAPHTCQGFTTAWEDCQDENSRLGQLILQESLTEFSMRLYSYLREVNPSNNLLFSPISIAGALSHLLLGARGDTRKAIQRAVCLPHDFHCIHFQMKKLREKLSSSLKMSSQIYYNPGMNLSESFINQSVQFYEAEPVKLLNSSEENTQMINSWAANMTHNKITHLVDSVPPHTQLMLLNAVFFNGMWKTMFDKTNVKGYFSKLNGDMVTVPVLRSQNYLTPMAFVAELRAQVARFALSGDCSLYILLPRSSSATDLQQLEERMTDGAVRQMIEQINATSPQPIEVTLPQIKMDLKADMNILIKKLGLSTLFEGANLCGLYPEDSLVLDDARHRAFLALNEKGVEAGAVTSLSFSRSFLSFSAMRPFILLLWSDQGNLPLFIGRVTDP
ncbi:plasma protease C1 inhibitor [Sphaeramia orbicularis]|uniref:Plasma protease C1 inhibitor-like n=1 Tax=Sphaeramia orbicularis TaxID=375764 RepID=A0A672YAJ6_9TELE|nr:plasma protease C1 inhibitor-like [Sphaeramia orbicularis]